MDIVSCTKLYTKSNWILCRHEYSMKDINNLNISIEARRHH